MMLDNNAKAILEQLMAQLDDEKRSACVDEVLRAKSGAELLAALEAYGLETSGLDLSLVSEDVELTGEQLSSLSGGAGGGGLLGSAICY